MTAQPDDIRPPSPSERPSPHTGSLSAVTPIEDLGANAVIAALEQHGVALDPARRRALHARVEEVLDAQLADELTSVAGLLLHHADKYVPGPFADGIRESATVLLRLGVDTPPTQASDPIAPHGETGTVGTDELTRLHPSHT